MRRLLVALGSRKELRVWRQNVGTIVLRDEMGEVDRVFRGGPPPGAADISGIVIGSGRRIEIECKTGGYKRNEDQLAWADFISKSGALYELATDAESVETIAKRVIERARSGR